MSDSVAIVGAGILGRLIALKLVKDGWRVTLYDRDGIEASGSCSYAAGGMLCPISELVEGSPLVYKLGLHSLDLWPDILGALAVPVYFKRRGSLLVAHSTDREEWQRIYRQLVPLVGKNEMEMLERQALSELEPELDSRFLEAIHFPHEGQIDNREVLTALGEFLSQSAVRTRFGEEVSAVKPHAVETKRGKEHFDWAIDARGLGARGPLKDLRGVRGEIISVIAPEVVLNRPVRLMHPRHAVYVVPRRNSKYLIGATCLETDDTGPITVRSMLELLSASFLVHAGFSEARVVETHVQCRPAFEDNNPQIRYSDGLVHANGLYRNGFLVAPAVAEAVAELLRNPARAKTELCKEIAA